MENKTIYITQIDHSRKLDVCYDVGYGVYRSCFK